MKLGILLLLASICISSPGFSEPVPDDDSDFSHSVKTQQKPWTKRPFRNDPDDFQFAIVTDRTGGMRPGVFARSAAKVNELQPEFVMSVGDLIPRGGRPRDEEGA